MLLWARSDALAQTPNTNTGGGTGTVSGGEQTKIADLPVCGQPATTSNARRSKSAGASSKSRTRRTAGAKRKRTAKRRAVRRKRAARRSPVRATLTLDQEDQETVTAATFGRSTDPQPLTLVYRVSGCRVTNALPWPRSPLPTGPVKTTGARALPLGGVQIDDVEADGDRYVVYLRVFVSSGKASDQGGISNPSAATSTATTTSTAPSATTTAPTTSTAPGPGGTDTTAATSPPDEFSVDPGSYTSFVRLKAQWLRTVATPVTVTRSEDSEVIPLGIGVLGGLCGFFVFWLLRQIHDDDLLVKETWVLWLAAMVSVVVGAGTAFLTNYLNQDLWTMEDNGLALFIAAFSASTGGVAAGLLTGIYKTEAANAARDDGGAK